MRKKILVANWKLNADYFSIKKFISNVSIVDDVDLYVAPSYLGLLPTLNLIGNKEINVCAQNVNNAILGDHTGSLSWMELKDYGIHATIVGHPETMKDFNEHIVSVNSKVRNMLENGFKVFLCVTETRVDLLKESSKEALKTQIKLLLKDIDPILFSNNLAIIYRPTFNQELSQRATPEFVIDTVKVIRSYLREEFNYYIGNNVPILYGGDYLSEDINDIIKSDHIDGLMIDDHKAISAKYNSLILKALYKYSTDSYRNFYDQNVIVREPLEMDREKAKESLNSFNEYEIDNDLFFKEVDLFEEDI